MNIICNGVYFKDDTLQVQLIEDFQIVLSNISKTIINDECANILSIILVLKFFHHKIHSLMQIPLALK